MPVIVNYKKKPNINEPLNLVLFVREGFNISNLKNQISKREYDLIFDLLKSKDKSKSIISFDLNSRKKIFLISVKNKSEIFEIQNLGAKLHNLYSDSKYNQIVINSDTVMNNQKNI